jgi:RNA polymerase sigma factor (sigma-70 family)
MTARPLEMIVQRLRQTTAADGACDADLLRTFVRSHAEGEKAFEALVKRHGPMVLGVARRILGNTHDAEDAFQAAFLVLARRASSIQPPGMLGNWLYGVARRTALEARRAILRRREKERAAMPRAEPRPRDSIDLAAVLDQEIARLPERLRMAIVLCELQGRTRREAARELGVAEGTIASRVARGRVLLATRLARHGFPVSAVALVAAFSSEAVSASLVAATVKTALGTATTGAVPMLAQGVMKAMLLNRLRNTVAVVLMACFACLGLGMFAGSPNASGQPEPAKKDSAVNTAALERLQGQWKLVSLQEDGKQVADVEIFSCFLFGNKLAVKDKKGESVHQLRFDATESPAAIDILDNAGRASDLAIYKLEGDTLFICSHPDKRPKEFATRKGDRVQLLTLRRPPGEVDAGLAAIVAKVQATDDAVREIQKVMQKLRRTTRDHDAAIRALEEIELAVQKMRQELRDEEQ